MDTNTDHFSPLVLHLWGGKECECEGLRFRRGSPLECGVMGIPCFSHNYIIASKAITTWITNAFNYLSGTQSYQQKKKKITAMRFTIDIIP